MHQTRIDFTPTFSSLSLCRNSSSVSSVSDSLKKRMVGSVFPSSIWIMPNGFSGGADPEPLKKEWPVDPSQVDAFEYNFFFNQGMGSFADSSGVFCHCSMYVFRLDESGRTSVIFIVYSITDNAVETPYDGDELMCAGMILGEFLEGIATEHCFPSSKKSFVIDVDIIYLDEGNGMPKPNHDVFESGIRSGLESASFSNDHGNSTVTVRPWVEFLKRQRLANDLLKI